MQSVCVELVELSKHETGVADCIDPDVVSAPVRRAPDELDFRPHETAMRGTDGELRRLGENRAFSAEPCIEKRAHAEALVFLVGHRGDHYLSLRTASSPARGNE